MKLYENIIIGNFLYGLGFAIRSRLQHNNLPSAINLLQQTPADKLLGDLLLTFPGVVRLIEFKAQGNYASKEHSRHKVLSAALAGHMAMTGISRRIHWYIETAASQQHAVVSRIVPYLDAFPKDQKKPLALETFIENLATDVVTLQSDEVQAKQEAAYLRLVKMTQGDGTIGSGGLLLVANADGTLHYAQLHDMMELRLEHGKWLEHHRNLEKKMTPTLELERKGPSRGMER